jgi:type III secretion system FlhB-like substrate exporter
LTPSRNEKVEVKHGCSHVVSWLTYQTSPVGTLFIFQASRMSIIKTRSRPTGAEEERGARRPLPGPNPTHLAVALTYDRDTMAAPQAVAKGHDAMAQRITEIARENGVPMVENIQLARALAKEVEIGSAVPTKWHQAVAGVLAMVYKIRKAG